MVVLVFLLSIINKKVKTITAENGLFLKELELDAVLIKDEKLYKLSENKEIDTSILEGKKIPVGTKVGNSVLVNDIDYLKKELNNIEDAILTLENSDKKESFKKKKDKYIIDYVDLIDSLQENIINENYEEVEVLKKEIISINKKNKDLIPQNNLLGQSIESLNKKKEEIKKEIDETNVSDTTKASGIFTYKIDGYENTLKAKEFSNYTYDSLPLSDAIVDSDNEIKISKKVDAFKIIDNFQWYLALKIDDKRAIGDYEIGDVLAITLPLKDKNLELKGNIIAINNSSNKSVVILKFNKYLHEFYNTRFPKVKLVQKKVEVLKIPKSVIFDQKGENGVFIKDFSGIVKYRPIKIISNEGEFTYIDKGDENLLINIDTRDEAIRTLSIYDEIILKPKRFKENQILD